MCGLQKFLGNPHYLLISITINDLKGPCWTLNGKTDFLKINRNKLNFNPFCLFLSRPLIITMLGPKMSMFHTK